MVGPIKRLVLFADILGFGALTQSGDSSDDSIDVIELIRPNKWGWSSERAKKSRGGWFLGFHSAVAQMTLKGRGRLGNHSVVSFSDSVFLTGDDEGVLVVAAGLMRLCLFKNIPVRMGIGYGTWTELQFGSSFTRSRRYHAAQFFGSGVSAAFGAEHQGGKGMRIFVHPSAALHLRDNRRLLSLPPSDVSTEASHELDYLKSRGGATARRKSFEEIRRSVNAMSRSARGAKEHYVRTRRSLVRMRAHSLAL
jgi:hypothetical protein